MPAIKHANIIDHEAVEAQIVSLLNGGLIVSPHKQAKAYDRYAPIVLGQALGIRPGVMRDILGAMIEAGSIEIQTNPRSGARLVAVDQGATAKPAVCPHCRMLVIREIAQRLDQFGRELIKPYDFL